MADTCGTFMVCKDLIFQLDWGYRLYNKNLLVRKIF